MKHLFAVICIFGIMAGLYRLAMAHALHYWVENRGISARVFYAEDDPASYSPYEIFGPGDKIPYQKGRTDRNGFVSFLPDRRRVWIINVSGGSEHGMHRVRIEVNVKENLFMDSFKKPLVAQYTKAFVGISFLLALFGLWALQKLWKKGKKFP